MIRSGTARDLCQTYGSMVEAVAVLLGLLSASIFLAHAIESYSAR
jgi:hypothetical protein